MLENVIQKLLEANRGIHDTFEELMRHKMLLLVGDSKQLPPVCKCRVGKHDICLRCHITASDAFQAAAKHDLLVSVRQEGDPTFAQLLQEVRHAAPTEARLTAVFGARASSAQARGLATPATASTSAAQPPTTNVWVSYARALEDVGPDFLALCSHLEDVRAFNAAALSRLPGDLIQLPLTGSGADEMQRPNPPPKLAAFMADPDFHKLPAVKVGARVIFTNNFDLKKGAANGASGTVLGVATTAKGSQQVVVKTETGHTVNVNRTLDERLFSRGIELDKSTFPLALGYAITGHKSQGATIDRPCVVVVRDAFAPGLVYTMLSRVTVRAHLRVVDTLRAQDCVPMPDL